MRMIAAVDPRDCRATVAGVQSIEDNKMLLKTLAAAFVVAILPGLAAAQCSSEPRIDQQAMSCAEGSQWDQATATCLPVTTS